MRGQGRGQIYMRKDTMILFYERTVHGKPVTNRPKSINLQIRYTLRRVSGDSLTIE